MKKYICLLSFFVLAIMPTIIMAQDLSEDAMQEALEKKVLQAETDRKLMPVFAATIEALRSEGSGIQGMMSSDLIAAALESDGDATHVVVGKSEVEIKRKKDIVVFSFASKVVSIPEPGTSRFMLSPDPDESLVDWVNGAHVNGVVFSKNGEDISVAIADYLGCLVFGDPKRDVYNACERFGLGQTYAPPDWASRENEEYQFLSYLMANYGVNGVLKRSTLTQALAAHRSSINTLIKLSEDKTGHIVYNARSATYSLVDGPELLAHVHKSTSQVSPGGAIEMSVNVYSERVAAVQVELRYEDGTAVAHTDFGNMAQAVFAREDMIDNKSYSFGMVKIKLPNDLKPGKIMVVAHAADDSGHLISHRETIGKFDYETEDDGED